jgi:hypothetical protein
MIQASTPGWIMMVKKKRRRLATWRVHGEFVVRSLLRRALVSIPAENYSALFRDTS